jgi:hypothetical protein
MSINDYYMDFGKPKTIDFSTIVSLIGRPDQGFSSCEYVESDVVVFTEKLRY